MNKTVVIVGGGLSGLTAAHSILNKFSPTTRIKSVNVIVLEAIDTITGLVQFASELATLIAVQVAVMHELVFEPDDTTMLFLSRRSGSRATGRSLPERRGLEHPAEKLRPEA